MGDLNPVDSQGTQVVLGAEGGTLTLRQAHVGSLVGESEGDPAGTGELQATLTIATVKLDDLVVPVARDVVVPLRIERPAGMAALGEVTVPYELVVPLSLEIVEALRPKCGSTVAPWIEGTWSTTSFSTAPPTWKLAPGSGSLTNLLTLPAIPVRCP